MSQPYGHDPYGQQPPSQPYLPQQPGHGYPPGPPPPHRRKSSAPTVLIVLGVLGLVFFGGCAAIIAALGSASDSPSTSVAVDQDESGGTETDRPKAAGMGAKVRDGRFQFTVTKLEKRDRVGGEFLTKEAQGVFLLVHVTVKNIGDDAGTFFGSNQKLHDVKGREYEASSEAALYLRDSQSLYEEINPGNSVNGVVLFDIPKSVKPTSIELHDSVFSGGVRVGLS